MLGIFIIVLGALVVEASSVVNKLTLKQHTVTVLDSALIVVGAGTIPFVIIALVAPETFVFSMQTLPTFSLRLVLEVVLILVGGYALLRADRSTFALLRTLTIPLLLVIDLFLLYPVTNPQIAGALIITAAILITAFGKLSRKGIFLSICTAILATATVTLFKMDLQHNSLVAEQLLAHLMILGVLLPLKIALHEPMPVRAFRSSKQTHFIMLTAAIGSILSSYAYALVPGTALVAAAKRGIGVLFALGSGKMVFHEGHLGKRAALTVAVVSGIVLMAIPEAFFTESFQSAAVFLSY